MTEVDTLAAIVIKLQAQLATALRERDEYERLWKDEMALTPADLAEATARMPETEVEVAANLLVAIAEKQRDEARAVAVILVTPQFNPLVVIEAQRKAREWAT